jgi:YD repeat-containing protein
MNTRHHQTIERCGAQQHGSISRRLWLLFCLLTLLVAPIGSWSQGAPSVWAGAPSYVYDDAGRLIAVSDPTSDTAVYNYDAMGNLLSITRQNSSVLSILNFTPKSGPIGTAVTIYGTGFSATPSQNTVTFNGTAATIVSATATQIVTTVPGGAATGPITVTTPTGSATSTTSFSVTNASAPGVPTITSFTPTSGPVGTAVTINGTNFDPTPANNHVRLNTTQATVTTASTTSMTVPVPAGATSGKIRVGTTQGTAVSSTDFVVPPTGFTTADIQNTSRADFGVNLPITVSTANKIALVLFEGIGGQRLSMNLSSVTMSSVNVSILTPVGATLKTVTSGTSGVFMEPILLPMTGTYTIVVDPVGTATGSLVLTIYNVPPDLTGTLISGVPSAPIVFTAPGQNGSFTIASAAGRRLSVLVTSTTFPSSSCNQDSFLVRQPDGTNIMVTPNTAMNGRFCLNSFAESPVLTQTGTYTITLDPGTTHTGQITLTAYDFTDVGGTIPLDTPTTVTLTIPGQKADVTFAGSAGQKVSILINGMTLTNCSGGALRLIGPSSTITSSGLCANGFLDTQTLATTGTYTVEIDPSGVDIGQVTVTVYNIVDVTGTITPGATTGPIIITTPGQNALLTFSATTNQRASARVVSSSFSSGSVRVLNPDGTVASSGGLSTGVFIDAFTLPVTGTYTLKIDPSGAATGQVTNLILYVFDDVTGSLTIGGPQVNITITVPGQRALLTFTGAAGQQISRHARNNTIYNVALILVKPDGAPLGSLSSNATNFDETSPTTLPVAGVYTLIIDPNNPLPINTGSINVFLTSP